jgi:DMSO/TMAO reductase YedYZ molybdopterin-dependent catalytic subunit
MGLPPAQRVIGAFPRRFGLAFVARPPLVPGPAVVRVTGKVAFDLDVPLSRLADLPRRDLVADFHCVTGWTAPGYTGRTASTGPPWRPATARRSG